MSHTNLASSGQSLKKSSIFISDPASITIYFLRFLSASRIVNSTVATTIAAMYKNAPIFPSFLIMLIQSKNESQKPDSIIPKSYVVDSGVGDGDSVGCSGSEVGAGVSVGCSGTGVGETTTSGVGEATTSGVGDGDGDGDGEGDGVADGVGVGVDL